MKCDFYKNYTTTSMLLGENEHTITNLSIKYFNHHISRHLPHDKKSSILDIGCGFGRYLKALEMNGYPNSFGIDPSEEQISYARDRLHLTNIENIDAISFLNKSKHLYDAILLLDVLEHSNLKIP